MSVYFKDNRSWDPLLGLKIRRKSQIDNWPKNTLVEILQVYERTKKNQKIQHEIYKKYEKEFNEDYEALNNIAEQLIKIFNKDIFKTFEPFGFLMVHNAIEIINSNDKYDAINDYLKKFSEFNNLKKKIADNKNYSQLPWSIRYPWKSKFEKFEKPFMGGSIAKFGKNFSYFIKRIEKLSSSKFFEGAEKNFELLNIEYFLTGSLSVGLPVSPNYIDGELRAFEHNYLKNIERKLRSFDRDEHLKTNDSYVYVLSNKSLPDNMYKIGFTTGLPEDRALELSSTELPFPYKVNLKLKTKDAEFVEKKILHHSLSKFRVSSNREFFSIDLNKLKDIFQIISENKSNVRDKDVLTEIRKKISMKV